MTTPDERKQTLVEHLTELRTCLIRSAISLVLSMAVTLFFSKEIFRFLQKPLLNVMPSGAGFIATTPLEALITYLKVALLCGIFLSSPIVLYHVWRFIAPALYVNEKRFALLFVLFTTFFFVGGAFFGYYVIFPVGFKFFVTALQGTEIQFLPRMEDYLGFISKMLLTFGLIFELPLILIFLARLGIIRLRTLTKARRYVLVLTFLVAGLLTPGPDVLSQFLLAIPLLILYELSILTIWIMEKREKA